MFYKNSFLYSILHFQENPDYYSFNIRLDITFMVAIFAITIIVGIIKKQSWRYYLSSAICILSVFFFSRTVYTLIYVGVQAIFFVSKRKPWTCKNCGTVNDVHLGRCSNCGNSRFYKKTDTEK